MDKKLFDLVDQRVPKFNPRIAEGYAVRAMQFVEGYVDRIFRTAAVDFPPELKYLGGERCTPYEEYQEVTRRLGRQQNNSSRSTFEVARSDMYMMRYRFSFAGEELEPRYVYLPFVTEAGMITIRGSTFSISPVAADNGISVGTDNIYIPLTRLKITFRRQHHHFYCDGERQSPPVVWSRIHQRKPMTGVKMLVKANPTIAHYLFAKYGLTDAFKQMLGVDVIVGDAMTINRDTYPEDKWHICTSAQLKPAGVRDRAYVASDIRLAIPRGQYNATVANMVGGFFYVVDHFPERVLPDYVNDTRLWMVLLGLIYWGNSMGEGKLAEEVNTHMQALDGYMDAESRTNLFEAGVDVSDIYQLFVHVIETFSQRVTNAGNDVSSMYYKRLKVLYYVMEDLTKAINNFMFKVVAPKKKALTARDVNKMLRDIIKPTIAMNINRDHIEVSSVSAPGDNKYFKITSQLALQTDSAGKGGRKADSPNDPSKYLHVSIAEIGSYSTMSKSEATGRKKINPYAKTDESGTLIRDPDKVELLDRVQAMIQRRN